MARGRKATPVLWRPDTVEASGPIYIRRFAGTPMGRVVEVIGQLPLEDYRDNQAITMAGAYLRWAMAEALRHKYGVSVELRWEGKPLDAKTRSLIKAEGLVLSKLLDIIEGVSTLFPEYEHPAYWWLLCCVAPNCHSASCMTDPLTPNGFEATVRQADVRRIYEGNTAALKRDENPFRADPSNRLFVYALGMAGGVADDSTARRGAEFYAAKLQPYIEARVALAKQLRLPGKHMVTSMREA